MNLVIDDAALATATRHRLWAEHLELPPDAVVGDPAKLVDESWWPTASQQLARRQAGAPLTHRLVLLPGLSHRSRRLLGPIQSLLVDGKQPPRTGPGSTVQAGPTAAPKRTSALTARKVSGSW